MNWRTIIMTGARYILSFIFVISIQINAQLHSDVPQPIILNYDLTMKFWRPEVTDPTKAFTAPVSSFSSMGSEVELVIQASNLPFREGATRPDPMCITSIRWFNNNSLEEKHKTEVVAGNNNPIFSDRPIVPYQFEQKQIVVFKLFDANLSKGPIRDANLGYAECSLGELVARGKLLIPLQKTSFHLAGGEIIVSVGKVIADHDQIHMDLTGHNLVNEKIVRGKPDPFVEIYKRNKQDIYELVFQTEVQMKMTGTPDAMTASWKTISLPVKSLCNGEQDRMIKFVVWDWDKKGGRDLIGEFDTTLGELRNRTNKRPFELFNVKKGTQMGNGQITLTRINIVQLPSFADYIRGGLQIHCFVAIDFTETNGNQYNVDSLHFVDSSGTTLNKYELAISSVLNIIVDYDNDKNFPTYGFGARVPTGGELKSVFSINADNTQCTKVEGVLGAYRRILREIELAKPVNFAPVIRQFIGMAQSYMNMQKNYFIFYILTNGAIADLKETEEAINLAAQLPISIVIAGIGEKEFLHMEKFDGDHTPTNTKTGAKARRDIVQFVPLKKFSGYNTQDPSLLLAKEALAEVTSQIVSYMESLGIQPDTSIIGQPFTPHPLQMNMMSSGLNAGVYQQNLFQGSVPPQSQEAFHRNSLMNATQVPPHLPPTLNSFGPMGATHPPYMPPQGMGFSQQLNNSNISGSFPFPHSGPHNLTTPYNYGYGAPPSGFPGSSVSQTPGYFPGGSNMQQPLNQQPYTTMNVRHK